MNTQIIAGVALGFIYEYIMYKVFFYSETLYPYLWAFLIPLIVFLALRKTWNKFARGFILGAYASFVLIIVLAFFGAASLLKMV